MLAGKYDRVAREAVLDWAEGRKLAAPRRPSLTTVIQRLYASEINCGLQSFWDGGVKVWLGDPSNGRWSEDSFDIEGLGEAAAWLDNAARLYYPDSEYAKSEA